MTVGRFFQKNSPCPAYLVEIGWYSINTELLECWHHSIYKYIKFTVTVESSPLILCLKSDIGVGCAKAFSVELPGYDAKQDIFAVRNQENIVTYKNQCPHTLVNLNWQHDEFLNFDKNYIQCSLHGALFQIHDGFCVWGPCQGQSLPKLNCKIENEHVVLFV